MHEQFLLAALDQARLGRGLCAPNPCVGAVAVQNNIIIAQGSHRGAGTPHAEDLALAQFPKKTPGVTLYVTLEPCNHWGRTPPCVDTIIQHGIERVVYAYDDPNPVVRANSTPTLLREHGIEVLHYPLPAIDAFYQTYRYWTDTKKPWVTVKIAQTLDGKIAGAQGARVHLSNAECAQFTHLQRSQSDVILTTARTINQDNPRLNVRLHEPPAAKPVAILDTRGSLNQQSAIFDTASHCHIYHDIQYKTNPSRAQCSFHGVKATEGKLDLGAVVSHLGHLGYHEVWVEAGAGLFSALHNAGLVNRTYLYLVPRLLGEAGLAAYTRADLFDSAHTVAWRAMGDNMLVTIDWQGA